MDNLFGSICLSDIPRELITTASNGKKYLRVEIRQRKDTDQYGNTHYVKAYGRKDQRRDGVNYYIGNLKPSQYMASVPAPLTEAPAQTDGNLPF